ncbi:hypothetical protein POTOM_004256 [Populus tomentosa]|uniref:Uncharacterized protein n=1 Tax=Populus tomentosa TaxID=118781 RepID=A0A8X8AJV8_POPTO|nr:hypothetical protein POTOM_004256 [Populus tomentosa]
MAVALVSVPTPRQTICTRPSYTYSNSWFHSSATTLIKYPSKPIIIPLSSSSTSSTSVVEDGPPPPSSDALPTTEDVDKLRLSGCKGCGREEIEKGCNGEGRIQGGIATVPGFGWWPIKAYRPCPGFLASGGRYRRQGQSMDEVAFGREQRETPVGISDEGRKGKIQGDLGGNSLERDRLDHSSTGNGEQVEIYICWDHGMWLYVILSSLLPHHKEKNFFMNSQIDVVLAIISSDLFYILIQSQKL